MKKVMLAALVAFGVGLSVAPATKATPADGVTMGRAAQVISPVTKVCTTQKVCDARLLK